MSFLLRCGMQYFYNCTLALHLPFWKADLKSKLRSYLKISLHALPIEIRLKHHTLTWLEIPAQEVTAWNNRNATGYYYY